MTIEFHCPHCDKLLKTPDNKAGVRANCPGCGQVVTIPDPVIEVYEADPSFEESPGGSETSPPRVEVARAADGNGIEHGSRDAGSRNTGSQYDLKPCPMCGAAIDVTAVRCRFCGETLTGPGASVRSRTNIDAGEILAQAWDIYRTRLGSLIGSLILLAGILFAIAFAAMVAVPVLLAGIGLAGGGGVRQANFILIFFGFFVLIFLICVFLIAVYALLQAGFHRLLLEIARGAEPDFSSLFSGSPFFWRFFWGNILFLPAITVGYLMCVIPGALLLLLFWPVFYVIVDRDAGMIDSLRLAYETTIGNYFPVLALFLAGVGCQLLGAFPGICLWFLFKSEPLATVGSCAGLLFSVPFWMILWPVAYCGMSGQVAAQPA